jgi:hypothetical protein
MVNLAPDRGSRYSQVNNILRPLEACFATSVTQCLDIRKYDLSILINYASNVGSNQPEDGLGWFLDHDAEVLANWRKWHIGDDAKIPVYLWADCMVFAVNKIFGFNVAAFIPDITFNKLVSYLDRGIPSCFSGKYTGISGHYVSVVGYNDQGLLINDPYGNTLKNGVQAHKNSQEGFHVLYSLEDYDRVSKNYGVRIE